MSVRRFRAHYGVSHRGVKSLLSDMKIYQPDKEHDVDSLFMAISWLKLYDLEEVMAGRWGFGEKHCRETVWEYAERIAAMKTIKISLNALNPRVKFAPVDRMHNRIEELRCSPNSEYWSHKFNGPGTAFEVVTDPVDGGAIRWARGPAPCSSHDITYFRGGKKGQKHKWDRSSLYFNIPEGVRLVGDSAYGGQPDKVSITKDAHNPETKKLFARMKSMQETCFKRLKAFQVLGGTFRHGKNKEDKLKKIGIVFDASAVLLQYDIENGYPLFEV